MEVPSTEEIRFRVEHDWEPYGHGSFDLWLSEYTALMAESENPYKDDTTRALVRLWAEHRAEGKRKGIDSRHEWETAPDWAHKEADEWVSKDSAFRLLVGIRLADTALKAAEDA